MIYRDHPNIDDLAHIISLRWLHGSLSTIPYAIVIWHIGPSCYPKIRQISFVLKSGTNRQFQSFKINGILIFRCFKSWLNLKTKGLLNTNPRIWEQNKTNSKNTTYTHTRTPYTTNKTKLHLKWIINYGKKKRYSCFITNTLKN